MPIVSRPHRRVAPRVYQYTDAEGGYFLRVRWLDMRAGKLRERAIPCPPGTTRAMAEVMLEDIERRISEGLWDPDRSVLRDRPPTLGEVCDELAASRSWRPSTARTFGYVRRRWEEDLSPVLIRELDLRLHLRPWWLELRHRIDDPKTRNITLGWLRQVVRFGVDCGYCATDLTRHLPPAVVTRKQIVLPTHEDLTPAFAYWRDVDTVCTEAGRYRGLALLYELVLYAGLRIGEVAQMRWTWIDWTTATLRLPAAAVKTKRDRQVPLSPAMVAALRAHQEQMLGPLATPEQRREAESGGVVWVKYGGKPYSSTELGHGYFRPAIEAAGLTAGREGVHPHLLRYMAISRMAETLPIQTVMLITGHRSESMHWRYRAATSEEVERARTALDAFPVGGATPERMTPKGGDVEDSTQKAPRAPRRKA